MNRILSFSGTIAEKDFNKWLAKRDASFGNDIPTQPAEQEVLSDTGSKKTVSTVDTKITSTKKRSKKMKGPTRVMSQDEIMRLNHSG